MAQSFGLTAGLSSKEETKMQNLARVIDERMNSLGAHMTRIDSYFSRTDPAPETAGGLSKPEQPDDMTFNGLQRRLAKMGEMLDRLGIFCERLERLG